MNYPSIPELSQEQTAFVIERLALKPHQLIEVQSEFERLFQKKLSGDLLIKINSDCKDLIEQKREDFYTNQVNSLPIAHSFTVLSLAQSRVEFLLKNEKTIRQNRKIDENGKEYFENETYVDDVAMQNWVKIAQNERFLNLKLEIEKIVKLSEVPKEQHPKPKSGFSPVIINTGFSIETDGKE